MLEAFLYFWDWQNCFYLIFCDEIKFLQNHLSPRTISLGAYLCYLIYLIFASRMNQIIILFRFDLLNCLIKCIALPHESYTI